ncbi:hypothetical protein L3X38_017442 [Prunus dulcis]|uniref:Uncharacterized protein n=1 Tax=Prunus dulcis TaxID=3755 RepID=A0AAD4W7T6_PRUDU|nr:hypothetical protein L3X38_017442 [Prunus dulcis]
MRHTKHWLWMTSHLVTTTHANEKIGRHIRHCREKTKNSAPSLTQCSLTAPSNPSGPAKSLLERKKVIRYYRYQFVGHPTTACQTLKRILHAKIHEGVLELPSRKQAIDEDPMPKRRGKQVAVVITCFDDLLDDDELCHPWKNDPKPPEAIW